MRLIATILTICLLAGCKAPPRPDTGPALGNGIGRAQGAIMAASDNVRRALPFTSDTGKPLLEAAQTNHAEAQTSLANAMLANAALQQTLQAERDGRLKAVADLDKERSHFFSYRQRHAFWWIVCGSLAIWLGLGIAGILLPAGGWGSTILRVLPFANPFAWFRDRFYEPGTLSKNRTKGK